MKKAPVYMLRENLAVYLDEIVRDGAAFIVTRYDKPIAKLVPVKSADAEKSYRDYFGFLSGKESGVDFEDRVRRNKGEKKYVKKLRSRDIR
jgi:antitoxin (DNA-binding transcriptional repressor) of toxin-antitoxin stability system